MKKLESDKANRYWFDVHQATDDDLAAVCFPGKPRYFNRFFDYFQRRALKRYIQREQVILKDKKLLDIGCGRGRWLAFYSGLYGAHPIGIDLSPEAVATCRARGLDANVASVLGLPFETAEFDIVNCITVLLHIPFEHKAAAISEIARVLKPGGKAIFLEGTWKDPSPHVYGWTLDKWKKELEAVGLSLKHTSGHYYSLFWRKLPGRIPMRLRDFITIHLDYPLDYILTQRAYGKTTSLGLQHLMVFEKA